MDICFAVGKYTNYGLGVEFDTMRYFKDQKQAIEYFNTVCAQSPDKAMLMIIASYVSDYHADNDNDD